MTIEFRCTGCDRLLAAPDDATGRQAKCPNCGTLTTIPGSLQAAPGSAPAFSSPDQYAETLAKPPPKPPPDMSNPYATSATYSPEAPLPYGSLKGLVPTQVGFEQVLTTTWNIFTNDLGPCLLVGLVIFGVNFAVGIFNYVVGIATQLSDIPALVIAGVVAEQIIRLLVQTFINVALVLFSLRLVRERRGDLSAFSAVGTYYPRALAMTFLMYFAVLLISALCLGPAGVAFAMRAPEVGLAALVAGIPILVLVALAIFLQLYLALQFLVDRNLGVLEAMQASLTFMRGNILTVLGLLIVVGLLGGLFAIVTCGLGSIAVTPFMALMGSVIYLYATGQPPTAVRMNKPYPA